MVNYNLILLTIGLSFLGVSFLPRIIKDKPLSVPIIFVLVGFLMFYFSLFSFKVDVMEHSKIALYLSEACIIISLMGTGLKLDRYPALSNWRITAKVLFGTIVLGVVGIFLISHYILGFGIGESVLLGAILTPTDPVLASDIQVGPPGEGKEDNVRYTLTSEAGFNDGLAFPFVLLALALEMPDKAITKILTEWFIIDVCYKIIVGILAGYIIGRFLAYIMFYLPKKYKALKPKDGFVIIAITFLSYSITEIFHGYGFLAVFICSIAIRHFESKHKFHSEMHDFSDQSERMILVILMILFGGALANGILANMNMLYILFAFSTVLLIRPITAFIAIINEKIPLIEKTAISFFGIKGIGSFYYLSYIMDKSNFTHIKEIWQITCLIVLISILIHGFTATGFFKKLDKKTEG